MFFVLRLQFLLRSTSRRGFMCPRRRCLSLELLLVYFLLSLKPLALPVTTACCISGTIPNGRFFRASHLSTMLLFRRASRLQTRYIPLSPPWTMASLTGSPPATKKHPPPRHNKFPELRHHLPLHLCILCMFPPPVPPFQNAQLTELSVLIPTDEPHRTSVRTGESAVDGCAQKVSISSETLIERLVGLSRIWALVSGGSLGPSLKKSNFKAEKVQQLIYLMPLRPFKNGSPSRLPLVYSPSRNTKIISCGFLPQFPRSGSISQGKIKKTSRLPQISQNWTRQAQGNHQDSSLIIGKTDAVWNKDRKTAVLGWVFSGQALEFSIHGSLRQNYIRSPVIAETSALILVLILEFSTLKIFSNTSTLVRAISSSLQSKEIVVVKDIRPISSGFASISFGNFSKNALVDVLAKRLFKPSYLCNGLQELGHLWILSLFS